MKWSWRIGRIGGVDIYIHTTFPLLLAWVGISSWIDEKSISATLAGVLFVLAIFGCEPNHAESGDPIQPGNQNRDSMDL